MDAADRVRALTLHTELAGIVGETNVLTDHDATASYLTDWTRRYSTTGNTVVRVGDDAELRYVMEVCRRYGQPVVPQGGNTGLVGGSIPHGQELVVSLCRLQRLEPVDILQGTVTAGAGVTLAALQRHVAGTGWVVGVDTSSRDSATVGGLVATNAGGTRVLRYGDMRAQVLGVEAVLGTGHQVSRLDRPAKDNTGYHLPGLLCGSEGTLGIVTAATLRLHPAPAASATALLGFASLEHAVAAIPRLRRELPSLAALELMLPTGIDLVCAAEGLPAPFPRAPAAVLLVDCAGGAGVAGELAGVVDDLGSTVTGASVGLDESDRRRLWAYRDRHTEAIARHGIAVKLDVTLPLRHLAAFCPAVASALSDTVPGCTVVLFGHAGDGNVHVNVLGAADRARTVHETVLTLVERLHGSISSEHGIGSAKREWLGLTRTPEEIEVFRVLRTALDPDGLLNPAVLLPRDEA